MKIWLFQFTKPDRRLVSARVAADTRQEACDFMGSFLHEPMSSLGKAPQPGTILSWAGEVEVDSGILSLVTTEGRLVEAGALV